MGYIATIQFLTVRVYLHSFSHCWLPNLWNPAKISRKFDLTTVQGHPRSSILVSMESA